MTVVTIGRQQERGKNEICGLQGRQPCYRRYTTKGFHAL